MPPPQSPASNLSAYELARLERIQFIQNEIKKIGLVKRIKNTQKEMRKQVKKPKVPRVKRVKKSIKPGDMRKSGRLAGKTVEYSKEIIDQFGVVEEIYGPDGKVIKKKTKKQKKKIQRKMFTPMTDAEKKKLEKMKDVLDGFENFLISLGDSDQNRKQVLRQARKMLSGQGVEHPRNNAFFRRNEPVHLGCDFGQLIEDAWDFENTYGEDYGHGWLLRHPLKKLWLYQSQLMYDNQLSKNKPRASTSESEETKFKKQSDASSITKKDKVPKKQEKNLQVRKTNQIMKRASPAKGSSERKQIKKRRLSRSRNGNEANQHKVGTRISMIWPDKKVYFGVVSDVSESKYNKKYTVEWDDGTETINLKFSQLQRVNAVV